MDPKLEPKAIKCEKLYLHFNFLGFYYIETYLVKGTCTSHKRDIFKKLTVIKICTFLYFITRFMYAEIKCLELYFSVTKHP